MPLCLWRWAKSGCPGGKFSLWQPMWHCALDLWPRRTAGTAVPHLLLSSIHTASRLSFVPTFCPARRLGHQRDIPFHTMPRSTIKAGGKEWRRGKVWHCGVQFPTYPLCIVMLCLPPKLLEICLLVGSTEWTPCSALLAHTAIFCWPFKPFLSQLMSLSSILPFWFSGWDWINWPPTPPHMTVTSPQSHCQVNMGTGGTEGLTPMQ